MEAVEHLCHGCGRQHRITTSQAGTRHTCECGRVSLLPSLGDMRRQAGLAAYEKPTAQVIIESVQDGSLPRVSECLECGRSAAEQRWMAAVCERSGARSHTVGGDGGGFIFGHFGGIPFLFPLGGGSDAEVVEDAPGRDVSVPLPAHICDECWSNVTSDRTTVLGRIVLWTTSFAAASFLLYWLFASNLSLYWLLIPFAAVWGVWLGTRWLVRHREKAFKSCLRREPLYAQLLEEYSDASIVEEKPSMGEYDLQD